MENPGLKWIFYCFMVQSQDKSKGKVSGQDAGKMVQATISAEESYNRVIPAGD